MVKAELGKAGVALGGGPLPIARLLNAGATTPPTRPRPAESRAQQRRPSAVVWGDVPTATSSRRCCQDDNRGATLSLNSGMQQQRRDDVAVESRRLTE